MPFYEYHCANCGHHHEELQKVTDKPLRKCPACGENRLHRLISAPVFRLKGGGWYETDFKSEKEDKRNLAGEREATETKSESTEKTPQKPEAEKKKAEPAAETKVSSGRTVVPVRKPPAGTAAKPKSRPPAGKPAKRAARRVR